MIKTLGILLGGIFVGAAGAEILRKKSPKIMDKLCAKASTVPGDVSEGVSGVTEGIGGVTKGIVDAFKKGYENATQPQSAAEPAT